MNKNKLIRNLKYLKSILKVDFKNNIHLSEKECYYNTILILIKEININTPIKRINEIIDDIRKNIEKYAYLIHKYNEGRKIPLYNKNTELSAFLNYINMIHLDILSLEYYDKKNKGIKNILTYIKLYKKSKNFEDIKYYSQEIKKNFISISKDIFTQKEYLSLRFYIEQLDNYNQLKITEKIGTEVLDDTFELLMAIQHHLIKKI